MLNKLDNQDYYSDYKWENVHKNVTCIAERYYDVWNRTNLKTVTIDSLQNWHLGLRNIQSILVEAENKGSRVRGVGSRWSLSEIAINKSFMLNTQPLDIAFIGLQS